MMKWVCCSLPFQGLETRKPSENGTNCLRISLQFNNNSSNNNKHKCVHIATKIHTPKEENYRSSWAT